MVISGLKVVEDSGWCCCWLVNPNNGESLVAAVVPKSLKMAKPKINPSSVPVLKVVH